MPRTISPDTTPPPDVELPIEIDLDDFWDVEDVEDVETTTRIPADESQRLVDAAFGPPR